MSFSHKPSNNAQYVTTSINKTLRWIEFLLFFVGVPLVMYVWREHVKITLLLFMMSAALLCVSLLLKDHTFKRFRFWNKPGFRQWIKPVSLQFLGLMLFTTTVFYILRPDDIFYYPKYYFSDWLLLLVMYPLLSAIPQEIIFRTFLFHRYKTIIPSKTLRIYVSSLCFGFAHLFYNNWVAVLLSVVAGYVFCRTYAQSRSTVLVIIEHSLWGLWMFTLGLGAYFDSALI